jgi:hypothetical protein
MSTSLDTTLIPKIKTIIDDYGKDVVFVVPGLASYDPDDGSVIESGIQKYTVKATPPENYRADMIDGDVIQQNDCMITISSSGLSFTPQNGLEVTFDDQSWRIMGIQTGYTGEDICLYEMQLRR